MTSLGMIFVKTAAKEIRLHEGARNEHQEKVLEGVAIWASYYRANIHRFVEDYFHIQLKLFQIFLLFMMNTCSTFVFIACRGLGKSFLSAVFCCARCILYPGTKICIASGTRGQSINVLEKIMTEMKDESPELRSEIDWNNTSINNTNAKVTFRNGSFIKVVTASDSSRGNRANVLLIDEFRMVKKDVIDTILRKFLSGGMRRPGYLKNPKYKDLKEHSKTLYLSSAFYKDHWSYTRCKDSCRFMLDETKSSFVCGFPYQLSIQEGLLLEEDVIEEMSESDFNEIKWAMEMCAEFWGDTEGSFFGFEAVSKNRKIEFPMLPEAISSKLPAPSASKVKIQPKQPGEKRILSADIALMASTKHQNDASALFINQLMPTKAGKYTNNIVYTESNEGMHTEDEALRIRKLFDEYDCDYIVLDTRNVGLSIYDVLARDLADPDTGEVYPALSCCNNADLASRCTSYGAAKVIWSVNGSAKFNNDCAIALREGFRTGKIRLLNTEYDGEAALAGLKGFNNLSVSDRSIMLTPYVNTTLLIGELINLKHDSSSGTMKLSEKSGARKDRYSSLSYNYWVSIQLENEMRKSASRSGESFDHVFMIRAPKDKLRERRGR